jgi:metallopeptidase MepB
MFALDIFHAGFASDTMSREAGMKYRKEVLELGGSQPEMKTLSDYLGRASSPGPYMEFIGCSTKLGGKQDAVR